MKQLAPPCTGCQAQQDLATTQRAAQNERFAARDALTASQQSTRTTREASARLEKAARFTRLLDAKGAASLGKQTAAGRLE